MTDPKPVVDALPSFERDEDMAAFLETHELSEAYWRDAKRGKGADPELDAILSRKPPERSADTSTGSIQLSPEVRAAVLRQAEQQGKTAEELVDEVLKKALKVS